MTDDTVSPLPRFHGGFWMLAGYLREVEDHPDLWSTFQRIERYLVSEQLPDDVREIERLQHDLLAMRRWIDDVEDLPLAFAPWMDLRRWLDTAPGRGRAPDLDHDLATSCEGAPRVER